MTSGSTTLLALIIISLGFLGIILSFLVPDRKKATMALALSGVIIFLGLYQFVDQSLSRYRLNQRMKDIQRDQQINLDQLREKMKTQTPAPVAPTAPQLNAAPKKK